MKCENAVKVGDVVKSLDFININDCYYVGLVVSISEYGTFRAKTIKRVWQGKTITDLKKNFVSETFVAPLPGNMLLDDLGTRIEVLA